MKKIFKKIIISVLTWESKLVLKKHKPRIIAITGSVGKTSTKDAVFHALNPFLNIRKNQKSFNSEIGVPLTILDLENAFNNPADWLKNIYKGFFKQFDKNYPEWLVLEIGVDRPGDIKRTASWLNPDIALITSLPKIPVHVEYFDSPEDVAKEKLSLIKYLKNYEDSIVILNGDDERLLKEKQNIKQKTYIYSNKNTEVSNVSFSDPAIFYEGNNPVGLKTIINTNKESISLNMDGILGPQILYSVSAAITIGLALKMPILPIIESFNNYQSAPGRMRLIEGKDNFTIIDDSYNSSPIALQKAIETLGSVDESLNKVAIIGDMAELGEFSIKEHEKVSKLINQNNIDLLITVGKETKAMGNNSSQHFDNSEEVINYIKKLDFSDSVLLIKGSQSMRMEKIIEEIMKYPNKKEELLVRQESFWKK